jgi:hypothetical protein
VSLPQHVGAIPFSFPIHSMRPVFLTLLLNPLIRCSSQSLAIARRTPQLEYPICRDLTYSAPHHSNNAMSSPQPEDVEQTERVRMPCMASGSSASASKQDGVDAAGEPSECAALPKLSAAHFRAYNSMATSMEYFVGDYCYTAS